MQVIITSEFSDKTMDMLDNLSMGWTEFSKETVVLLIISLSFLYNIFFGLHITGSVSALIVRVAHVIQQVGFSLSGYIIGDWVMRIGQDGFGILNGLFYIFLVNNIFSFFRSLLQTENTKELLENMHHVFTFSIVRYFIRNHTKTVSDSVLTLSLVFMIIFVFYVQRKRFVGSVFKESSVFFVQQLLYRKTSDFIVSLFRNVDSVIFIVMCLCSILLIDVIYKLGVKKVDVYLTWMILEQLLTFINQMNLPPILVFMFLVVVFYLYSPNHGFIKQSDEYILNTIKLALSKSYSDLIHEEVKQYDFFILFIVYIVAISIFLNVYKVIQ